MEIIAVANQKGGVAKTTTSVNVSVALAKQGKRVCLVDMDSQGDVALSFGCRPERLGNTILNAFMDECKPEEAIIRTHYKVDILPANRSLSAFNLLVEQNKNKRSPAFWLRELIGKIETKYDYFIIDSPPALDWLTINGLSASDKLLIPMVPEFYAEAGVADLIDTYKSVKKNYNPKIEIIGIVMTIFSKTNLSDAISQDIRKFCDSSKIHLFETVIKRSVRFGEAAFQGQPAIYYARNEAVQDYVKLTEEMIVNV